VIHRGSWIVVFSSALDLGGAARSEPLFVFLVTLVSNRELVRSQPSHVVDYRVTTSRAEVLTVR
jgi:predicted transcriptional regulator of viral defense system